MEDFILFENEQSLDEDMLSIIMDNQEGDTIGNVDKWETG